ncbi:SIR2 family protein [Aquaspirillum serpens]|uniref:SIR2 family protein n=1 Tax=Aquaspirillum serpens TaxID=190 RepID=UPI0003B399DF|nr:SIR2 family protein [Aquaspirillum serpens]
MTTENANSWGFEIRSFDQPETQTFLRSILRQDSCVPFLGAGFTRGEQARFGKVPGGAEWMNLMCQQIKASPVADKPSEDELASFGFQDISDIYFREKIVPLNTIKESVNSYFTKVKITDEAKLRFLSIDWPYIYTLNIDDGIEVAIDGVKVLPYKNFSRHSTRRYVYKLHGDAEDVLTAANHDDLRVIFGKADYIKSLSQNQYLISSLVNDFSEKNILFIGCSLSDELDISFALASVSGSDRNAQTARIFVTTNAPKDYVEKRKLKSYGITDVVVVADYFTFYNFVASSAEREDQRPSAINTFEYNIDRVPSFSDKRFVSYLLQSGWKNTDNPYTVSVHRAVESTVSDKLKEDTLVVIWGRRFSGRSTVLQRVLADVRTRRRFLINSQASISDQVFNTIFQVQDAVIGIDSGAIQYNQLRELAQRTDTLKENNTTVLLAISRVDLNALGNSYVDESVHIESKINKNDAISLNELLDPLGFQRWNSSNSILDNVFTLGSSSIAMKILGTQSKLNEHITAICSDGRSNPQIRIPSKFEFSLLYYVAIRQRIFSFVHRTLANKYGLEYVADTHITEFSKKWAPFIELEDTDSVSRRTENSASVLVCNSYAWTQLAVRRFSDKLGVAETASFIVDLYTAVREIDKNAYELILFDNLNSVYSSKKLYEKDWGASVITTVYEKLAQYCAQEPDYWLQRAKGVYYLSNDETKIRIAIEYCEKGIVEKAVRTGINAKLTKANLLGKLCKVTRFCCDDDLAKAIDAYVAAIECRNVNSSYIDGLLHKNQQELGYMSAVCKEARNKPTLLSKQHEIRFIDQYVNSR